MATTSTSDGIVQDLNMVISALIAERERLVTLFKPTLPGGYSLWAVVPESVRTSVRDNASTSVTNVSATLAGVAESIGAL